MPVCVRSAAFSAMSRSPAMGDDRVVVRRLCGTPMPAERQVARFPQKSESCSKGILRRNGSKRRDTRRWELESTGVQNTGIWF